MSNAPSFDNARETLAGLLDNWVFGTVTSIKVPEEGGVYFHGMARTSKGRAWFQQSKLGRRPQQFGPVQIDPRTAAGPPQIGDVIMGRFDKAEGKNGKLSNWYTDVAAIRELARVCLKGTNKREFQLLGDMRTEKNDDTWALCRLIMFGNVRAFADAHVTNGSSMRLSTTPLEFVRTTSELLCDPSVWAAFVQMVPDAQQSVETYPDSPDYTPISTAPQPPPFSPTTYTHASYNPAAPEPQSPPYDPVSPPASPPYNPMTPPASPPYNPVSPPPSGANVDITALAQLITQYCPPPVEPYDPINPGY